jgi:hypothetical protein
MFLKTAVVSFVSLFGVALGLVQNKTITFAPQHGALELTGSHGQILVDANDWWGVQKAAGDLAIDFGRVTGKNLSFWAANSKTDAPEYIWHAPTSDVTYAVGPAQTIRGPKYTGSKHGNTLIIVGTIGHSSLIDNLVNAKKIDVSKIKGKWESFVSQVVSRPIAGVERALVIAGSDPRGTIFGVSSRNRYESHKEANSHRSTMSQSRSASPPGFSGLTFLHKLIEASSLSTLSKFKDHQVLNIAEYS